MVKKLMVSMLALAAFTSCSDDLGITSVKEAETLDPGKKFEVVASVSGADAKLTRGIFVPSETEDLVKNGLNVTMFTQTGKNAWKSTSNTTGKLLFTTEGKGFGNAQASWTEAGINDVYGVYSYQNALHYDQTSAMKLQGDNSVYPLDGDPVVAHFKGSYQDSIPLTLYHIGAQVRLDCENKSDYDIRVSAELDCFYGYKATNFTWKEPVAYKLSSGTEVKKLPNSCWKVSNENFVALALGKTAGSVKEPFTNKSGVKTLVRVNTVPILYKAVDDKYSDTQIKYTIYWQKNGVEQTPIVYTKKVEELQAGVCHIYKLNIEGSQFPKPILASEVKVDEWTDRTVEWTVKPWETVKHNIKVSSNDESMGTVNLSGINSVAEGETLTLKAEPLKGFKFVKWSDGEVSATRTITATKDMEITAIFAKYKSLYTLSKSEFTVSEDNKMSLSTDGHTWTKGIVADAETGIVIPTGTGYSDKVFNLDPDNEGKLILKEPTETFVYIPVPKGSWTLTFNDKTLEYKLVAKESVEDYRAKAKECIDHYESEYGDINDFSNVTEDSKKALLDAVNHLKELLAKQGTENSEFKEAVDSYWAAVKNIKTTDIDVDIEEPTVK